MAMDLKQAKDLISKGYGLYKKWNGSGKAGQTKTAPAASVSSGKSSGGTASGGRIAPVKKPVTLNGEQTFRKSYNFYVELNGISMSFAQASGLQRNVSMQTLQEGGINNRIYYLRNPASEERVVTLTYGMAKYNDNLNQLTPGRYLPRGVLVGVMNDRFESAVTFSLDGCYIKRLGFGDLDASGSKIMINTLEIAYSRITTIS